MTDDGHPGPGGDAAAGRDEGGGEVREQSSILSGPERRFLDWVIPRLPSWVTPDLLTGGALAAMAVAGLAYAFAADHPWLLHVVNACLFAHWFGDSTDGGLARFRKRSRPRYGFYVDHMSDAVGGFFVGTGAALSGIVSPWIAVLLLVLYLLLAVHAYLATFSLGVFHLSYAGVGPTELRLAVVICNLFVLWRPSVDVAGRQVLTYDIVGGITCVILAVILMGQVLRTTVRLYELERVPSAGDP